MKLAYTMAPGRGDTDALLFNVAKALQERGRKLAGTVQTNSEVAGLGHCDMDVLVLPDGPVIRISQSLGAESRGCRLDPAALEHAVAQAQAQVQAGAEIVLINKFGKHEAEGRGFRDVIAEALALEIPVIVGLNATNKPAFDTFCDGAATELAPDLDTIVGWLETEDA